VQIDPAIMVGAGIALMAGIFALRVAVKGNAAFAAPMPKRVRGRRALHGDADWMLVPEAAGLFSDAGGIVVGERYRVDKDSAAAEPFRAMDRQSWGIGGRAPLLCFDATFGSSHGIVFAGSGGFKTTSVTIPTALKWGGALVVLDPSNEVAPMVIEHRRAAGRTVHVLDPREPGTGFNALDWI
ncbi:type IV secretory system conjugative DNA transfer family protein, partial [Bradyrhizobium japonicum]